MKDEAPRSGLLSTSRTPIRNFSSTSFLVISLHTFGTGYGHDHIGSASSFNLKFTGYVFRYQVFRQTTLRISVIILAIHYVVLLSYVCIDLPLTCVGFPFNIQHLILHAMVKWRYVHVWTHILLQRNL